MFYWAIGILPFKDGSLKKELSLSLCLCLRLFRRVNSDQSALRLLLQPLGLVQLV